MSIFNSIKNKRKEKRDRLIEWQNTIMAKKSDRLLLNEKQLRHLTIQQAQIDLKVINDCKDLVQSTKNPEVFFMRLNLLKEKTEHLCTLEKFIDFKGASPSDAYNEILAEYQVAIKQFLIRYFTDTFDKAETLKTDKGKYNRYKKFYDSLQEYYDIMSEENIDYIETKFKAYTRGLKGGDARK